MKSLLLFGLLIKLFRDFFPRSKGLLLPKFIGILFNLSAVQALPSIKNAQTDFINCSAIQKQSFPLLLRETLIWTSHDFLCLTTISFPAFATKGLYKDRLATKELISALVWKADWLSNHFLNTATILRIENSVHCQVFWHRTFSCSHQWQFATNLSSSGDWSPVYFRLWPINYAKALLT